METAKDSKQGGRRWIDSFDELTDAMADGGPLLAACVAVRLAGVSKERVYQLIRSGALWSCRIKGQLHVRVRDLNERWGRVTDREKAAVLALALLWMGVCMGRSATVAIAFPNGGVWTTYKPGAASFEYPENWEPVETVSPGQVIEVEIGVKADGTAELLAAETASRFFEYWTGCSDCPPASNDHLLDVSVASNGDLRAWVTEFPAWTYERLDDWTGQGFVVGVGIGGAWHLPVAQVRAMGGGSPPASGPDTSQVSSVADFAKAGAMKALGVTVAILFSVVLLGWLLWALRRWKGGAL